MMKLFNDFTRKTRRSLTRTDSQYDYLNNSAYVEHNKLRIKIDSWFTKYAQTLNKNDDEHRHFISKFQSSDNESHYSAFFELFIHELLVRLSFQPTIHPELPDISTKRPDFGFTDIKGNVSYLEALCETGVTDEERKLRNQKEALIKKINELKLPYYFHLGFEKLSKETLSKKILLQIFNNHLSHLETSKILTMQDAEKLPKFTLKEKGWEIRFYPYPKTNEQFNNSTLGNICSTSSSVMFGPGQDTKPASSYVIQNKIREKTVKYKIKDKPFIIALNLLDPWATFASPDGFKATMADALWGALQILSNFNDKGDTGVSFERYPQAVWQNFGGYRHNHLSAVLVVVNLAPLSLFESELVMYHNPNASHKIDCAFDVLPHAKIENNRIKYCDGQSLKDLIGI